MNRGPNMGGLNHYADNPKKINANEAYRTWKALVDNHDSMERTVLDLLAHPDATDEQIQTVRARLIERRKVMRETYELVYAKLNGRLFPWRVPTPRFMEGRG